MQTQKHHERMTTLRPVQRFDEIKRLQPEDIDPRVLYAIQSHRSQMDAISRRQLIKEVHGVDVPLDEDLSNNVYDRQNRLSIGRLQEQYPILSSSGSSGYWYGQVEEILACAAEIDSRALALLKKSKHLREMAEELSRDLKPIQLELPVH